MKDDARVRSEPPAGIRTCAFASVTMSDSLAPRLSSERCKRVARFEPGVSYQQYGCRCFLHPLLLSPAGIFVNQHPLLPRFKGVGLIAPAIKGNPPPAPVVAALRYLVAPVIPRRQIPDALESGATALFRFFFSCGECVTRSRSKSLPFRVERQLKRRAWTLGGRETHHSLPRCL